MRISRLDLLRFGKFTDRSVFLPQARRDFHLIVGPNEAGKSTLRSAILDLLFGIETRSRFNFLHAHSDMRLGALLEHDGNAVDFVRIKARNKTLQSSSGVILPDNALKPFLDTVDRGFFDKMFGLDHERLVIGGREILNASNDIGQILFQSAAGIGSLSLVRDALETEANTLWAKRKSNEREYYAASDELEQAEASLKLATVRTKDWVTARDLVEKLEEELDGTRRQYRALEQERVRLDRIRRAAPLLITLQTREGELREIGDVTSLPPESGKRLADAELAIAKASQSLKVFSEQAEKIEARVGAIHPDVAVLARQADIQALAEQRQQVRNHPTDIGKRQEEVNGHWKSIEKSTRELGWPVAGEDALEGRIPSRLIRSTIDALIRRHDILTQALTTAEEAMTSKQSEIHAIDAELHALPTVEIPPGLREALAAARAQGDVTAQERKLATQLSKAQRDLETATLALGPWQLDFDHLRRMQLPTPEEIAELQNLQSDLAMSASSLAERITELQTNLSALELEISQYQDAHHPLSFSEIILVRGQRDDLWQRIKAGTIELPDAAPDYEARVAGADGLSDQRHDKAREASELQAKLDQKTRLDLQLTELITRQAQNAQLQIRFTQDWATRATAIGFSGMLVSQVNAWRMAREHMLHATDTMTEARLALEEFRQAASSIRSALADELRGIVDDVEAMTLSALVLRAGDAVDDASRAQERLATLSTQKTRTEQALADCTRKLTQAQSDVDVWRAEWVQRLVSSHLPQDADTGAIEGALTLFTDIDDHLRQMRELRTARIDAMQRDLDDFESNAAELARVIDPELLGKPSGQVAQILAQRLAESSDADKELQRLKQELEEARKQSAQSEAHIQETQAELVPLLHLAKVANNDELRIAIERSELARTLRKEIRDSLQALQDTGDGLSREELEVEFAAADLPRIPSDLTELQSQVGNILERQNRIAAELNSAQEALGMIAGQGEAARAESLRQEALARMANAAERYIRVYTAAKLLRWAIERYRETKQGPMLSRAGDIFSSLTLGAFSRLVVDYDSEPLTLYGQRATGEHVAIEGLSDGTRDQLYLALRLAALEMQIQQAPAMPFIADDLFINYDDDRSRAGLEALAGLSELTQVIFLTHHDHLVPVAQSVFGTNLNVIKMA